MTGCELIFTDFTTCSPISVFKPVIPEILRLFISVRSISRIPPFFLSAFLPPLHQPDHACHENERRQRSKQDCFDHQKVVVLRKAKSLTSGGTIFQIRINASSPYEQPPVIDPIRRAGIEGHQILPVLHTQVRGLFLRPDDTDRIDLVSVSFSKHPDQENVSLLQISQMSKQFRRRQPGMACYHSVGALPANGQGSPVHMAAAVFQILFPGAVCDREGHSDRRYA